MTPYFEAPGVTLYHGDCLEVMAWMAAGSVDAILTDLPYGTTACSWDNVIPFAPMWAGVKHALKPRGVFVTTASQPFTSALVMSNVEWFRHEIIWEKDNGTNFLNLENAPFKVHENIIIFSRSGNTYNPQCTRGKRYRAKAGNVYRAYIGESEKGTTTVNEGTRHPRSVFYCNLERGDHPTQKPVALYEYLIRTYTNPGELVADICTGSGTTAISCIRTGRRFVGAELEERYCEIAARRIESELLQPRLFTESVPEAKPEQTKMDID